jgi:hypothetical protein
MFHLKILSSPQRAQRPQRKPKNQAAKRGKRTWKIKNRFSDLYFILCELCALCGEENYLFLPFDIGNISSALSACSAVKITFLSLP